jgi:hypothetical protein
MYPQNSSPASAHCNTHQGVPSSSTNELEAHSSEILNVRPNAAHIQQLPHQMQMQPLPNQMGIAQITNGGQAGSPTCNLQPHPQLCVP